MDDNVKKFYPPVIEGTIPAFYGTTLVVPFSMNRAVGKNDIRGFSLKIKTIQTNTFVANIKTENYTTTEAVFDISSVDLLAGQYYKIQLAYVANDNYSTVGYYSTVGVVKYYGLEGPKIYIDGLSNKKSNLYAGYYLGVFEHDEDPMEKIAQYRFIITYSNTGDTLYDTGWLLHSTINDVDSFSANDAFKYTDDLDGDTTFYLQYKVITSNNMECSSPRYNILQKDSIGTTLNLKLKAESDYDNGFVLLSLKSLSSAGDNATLTGAFEISRQNVKNPRHWEVIDLFILQNEVATKTFWKDFTVTHGETYKYAIRQFNEAGVYTNRVLSNEVFVDFEDAYLFDGKRQLKIRYNPKVSSFKNDIPESKTDTIGSKYPFIFRNGHVNYKEFPISGLISYFSDEQELFLTNEEIGIVDTTNWSRNETNSKEELPLNAKTTDLTNYNIAAERKFKLEVLEWLTNGKPKLFRSPTEGNYIVRLLNTSLTPTDSVGRMLHTFSCTAYEVAKCEYDNLVGYGFIDNGLSAEEKQRDYYRTVPLGYQGHENDEVKYEPIIKGTNPDYPVGSDGYIELLKDPYSTSLNPIHAYAIYFDDMNSGDIVLINGREHIIGSTGQFILDKTDDINSVKIKPINYSYLHEDEYNAAVEKYKDETKETRDLIDSKQTEKEKKETDYIETLESIETIYDTNPLIIQDANVVEYNAQITEKNDLIEHKNNIITDLTGNEENGLAYWNTRLSTIQTEEGELLDKQGQKARDETVLGVPRKEATEEEAAVSPTGLYLSYEQQQARLDYLQTLDINALRGEIAVKTTASQRDHNRLDALDNTHIPSATFAKNKMIALRDKTNDVITNRTERYAIITAEDWQELEDNVASALQDYADASDDVISAKNILKAKMDEDGVENYPPFSTKEYNEAIAANQQTIEDKLAQILEYYNLIVDDQQNAEEYVGYINQLNNEINAIQEEEAEWANYLETYAEYYADIDSKESDLDDAFQVFKEYTDQKNTIYEEIGPIEEEYAALRTDCNRLMNEYNDIQGEGRVAFPGFYDRVAPENNINLILTCLDNIDTKKEALISEYDTTLANVNALDAEIRVKTQELQECQNDYRIPRIALYVIDARIHILVDEIETLTEEIAVLEADIAQKENVLQQIDDINNQIAILTDEILAIQEEIDLIKKEKEEYINSLHIEELEELMAQKEDLYLEIYYLSTEIATLQDSIGVEPTKEEFIYADDEGQNYILDDFTGLFSYKYTDLYANSFDLITGQKLVDYPCRQFIGANMDTNILNEIVDVRTELLNILQIQADLKQIEDIYTWSDVASFDEIVLDHTNFNKYFSFDKTKMPGEDRGYSYDEIIDNMYDPNVVDLEKFNRENNSLYIYKIHPIFKHEDYNLDADIPIGYIETLSPWEKNALRLEVIEMLAKYNLTLQQVSDFVNYRSSDDIINYQGEEKTLPEMIKIISEMIDNETGHPEDYWLLQKYYGLENFSYNLSGDDPHDSHPEVLSVYRNGKWEFVPVEYHKNENYYTDATYYTVNNFTKTLDTEFKNNKIYYTKENNIYNIYEKTEQDTNPYTIGLYEKTAYKEFDKYHTFDEDYYLIYVDNHYKVVKDYSSRIYINTGASEGVTEANGELYTAEGEILQPYIDLANTGSFKTNLIPDITDIYVGDGVILNLSYQVREIGYIVEETNPALKEAHEKWLEAVAEYTDLFYKRKDTAEELYDFFDEDWTEPENYPVSLKISKYVDYDQENPHILRYKHIKDLENNYITLLEEKIEKYKEERGIE